jgi:ribosomal protein L29
MAALQADNARLASKPTAEVARLHSEVDSLKAQLFQERQQREPRTMPGEISMSKD